MLNHDQTHPALATRGARSANWLVIGAFIALTANIAPAIFYSFGLFLIPMNAELGWSRSMLSAALLVITVVTIFSSPVTGWLVDRYGMSRIVAPAIILLAASIASLAWVRSPAPYFAAFVLMGLVGVAHSPLSYSREIAKRFTEHRGKALGIAMAGIGIGGTFMPVLAQHMIVSAGWRSAFVAIAATVLVVGMTGFLVFRIALSNRADRKRLAGSTGCGWRALWREQQFRRLLIAFFLIGFTINGAMSHLGAILGDRGVDHARAAAMQSATGIAMIAGRIGCGFLLDRFHPRHVAILFMFTPLSGLLLLTSSTGSLAVFPACILIGLGLGAEADLLSYFTARYFPVASFSEISGYFYSGFTLGVGMGTVTLARSFDLSGSYAPGLYIFCGILTVQCMMFRGIGIAERPAGSRNHPA